MDKDRSALSVTSSGPGENARSGQNTRGTHLSPLSVRNAGQTGLNRSTQAKNSTSTWYAFAGQVIRRRTLPHFVRVFGVQATGTASLMVFQTMNCKIQGKSEKQRTVLAR